MIKIIFITAARPNFIKIAPIINETKKHNDFDCILVHTGQHYDKNMSDTFFGQLDIPKPNIHLNIGSGSHAEQTGNTMIAFEKICLEEKPDLVVVVGDVNATAACAIAAKKCHVQVAHIEAGLRSFDREMPEEINRLVTDSISDIFYTTCKEANDQLKKEGYPDNKIVLAGNLMIDTLFNQKEKAAQLSYYKSFNLTQKNYALLTLHRPSNVDYKNVLNPMLDEILYISNQCPIVFPVHPRTKQKLEQFKRLKELENHSNIHLCSPIGYLEMLSLTMKAKLVLTDSGGLQEETAVLGIPCLTLRENTERPITITEGSNQLVGTNPKILRKKAQEVLNNPEKLYPKPSLWDGKAAERIVTDLKKRF